MNTNIEEMYAEIGRAAISLSENPSGKILVYAEIENGVISADAFYVNDVGIVRYRFCPKPMQKLIYSFWEKWKGQPNNREWRVMSYIVDDGRFKINFSYDDELRKDEDTIVRRSAAVKVYFGNAPVDYSHP